MGKAPGCRLPFPAPNSITLPRDAGLARAHTHFFSVSRCGAQLLLSQVQ